MATVKDLVRAADQFGGSVAGGRTGRWHTYYVDAPTGMTWNCADIHSIKVEWLHGDDRYRDEAIQDALERIAHGVDTDESDLEDYEEG